MEEATKIWMLEQLEKLKESIKEDLEKVHDKMENYVSHPVCDDRRKMDIAEKGRVEKRMDDIDDDMDKIKESFDSSLNKIRISVWTFLGAIIGEIILLLINSLNK